MSRAPSLRINCRHSRYRTGAKVTLRVVRHFGSRVHEVSLTSASKSMSCARGHAKPDSRLVLKSRDSAMPGGSGPARCGSPTQRLTRLGLRRVSRLKPCCTSRIDSSRPRPPGLVWSGLRQARASGEVTKRCVAMTRRRESGRRARQQEHAPRMF